MSSNHVRLSQCMIVKNEEKNIERALSWGKDVLYEQIVVDTGSTDNTVKLAEAMGARVYQFPWIDDFAAAKNFAISKASGDWIALLDADEYILPEGVLKLIPLLERLNKTDYHVMLTSWLHVDEKGKVFAGGVQTRIFRNLEGLRFINRIHEELAVNGATIFPYTVDASREVTIFHSGYNRESRADKGKGERNARLIHMELAEHPDNYNMMGYLGDAYYAMEDELAAEEWYRKSIRLMPPRIEEYDVRSAVTFWKLMVILSKRGEEGPLMEIYEKAVRLVPKESDYDYIAGTYYTTKKNYRKGARYLEQAVGKLEQYGQVNGGDLLSGNLQGAWELLALCHYQNGDLASCVKYCTCLLKADRYLMSTLVMMMCAFRWDEERRAEEAADAAQVAAFLEQLYDIHSLKDRVFLLRAAMKADYDSLVKKLRAACSLVELECFDRSMKERSGQP